MSWGKPGGSSSQTVPMAGTFHRRVELSRLALPVGDATSKVLRPAILFGELQGVPPSRCMPCSVTSSPWADFHEQGLDHTAGEQLTWLRDNRSPLLSC